MKRNKIVSRYKVRLMRGNIGRERKRRGARMRREAEFNRNSYESEHFQIFFSSSVRATTLMHYEPATYEQLKRHMGINIPATQRVFFNKGL